MNSYLIGVVLGVVLLVVCAVMPLPPTVQLGVLSILLPNGPQVYIGTYRIHHWVLGGLFLVCGWFARKSRLGKILVGLGAVFVVDEFL